ncbi:hypothetical protein ABZ499_33060 [Streptomyces sp. NPDC019990]|uniref:hypothetical protein n=1 Tax=Streptomyces sp. NPDC019990 TaxID=3154693 RepID=UPI0033C16121
MTRTNMAIAVAFGFGFVFAVSVGGGHISAGRWGSATVAYGGAALCVLGASREASRATLPGGYTDDEPATPPVREAGPLTRLLAARKARRVLRESSEPCSCRTAWVTGGAEHDRQCPQFRRSAT